MDPLNAVTRKHSPLLNSKFTHVSLTLKEYKQLYGSFTLLFYLLVTQ